MNARTTRPGERPDDDTLERLLRGADPVRTGDTAATAETDMAMEATRMAIRQAAAATRVRRRRTAGTVPAGAAATSTAAGSIVAAVPVAAFTTCAAPWGTIHIAAADGGIVAVELRSETAGFVDGLARRLHGSVVPAEANVPAAWRATLETAKGQLGEYFAGRRSAFDLPWDLQGVSEWDRRVLSGAASLGFGEVTSYGELARRIGKPGAARAVGGALGRNPIPIVIPCHRILAADGTIGGYGGGHGSREAMLGVKRQLLSIEHAVVAG